MAAPHPDRAVRARPRATPGEGLARAWPSLVAGLVAAGLLTSLAWDAGGYFRADHLGAGAVAFVVVAVLVVARPPARELTFPALIAVASLAGLAAWGGLSALWAASPDRALEAMQLDLSLLGIFALGIVAVGSGRYSRHVLWGCLAVLVVVSVGGLLSRLYPDVVGSPRAVFSDDRLAYPLSYWNALGGVTAIGSVLAFGLAADPRTQWVLRGLAAAASVALAVTMYLTLSRGSWVALFAGVVVVMAFSAHRGSMLLTLGLVASASVTLILRLESYPELIGPATAAAREQAGHDAGPQVLVVVLLAGAAQAAIGALRSSEHLMVSLDRALRPLLIVCGVLLALVTAGAYVWKAADAEGVAARGLKDASGWVEEQWDEFQDPGSVGATGTDRLTTARGTRSDLYGVALETFGDHPVAGAGAGSYRAEWARRRSVLEDVQNAHSLPLEVLAERGVVGLALLLAFLGSLTAAGIRARLRPGGLTRSQAAAAAGACSVWLVHAAVDWDWQMPALTGTVLVLAATLLPRGRGVRRRADGQSTSTRWRTPPRTTA